MEPIGCMETTVTKYHSTLRNISEERGYFVHRGGSLKSRKVAVRDSSDPIVSSIM